MKIELWPIKKLIPYARNARKIPQSAIDKVAASIQEFGFRQPIVVDTKRVIIVGHVRLLAAQKLEYKEVPVHIAKGLTPAQVRAYRLMDNRSHQEAEWDYELLSPELAELKDLDFNLSLTGFEQEEIATFLAEKTEGLTDEDAAPPIPEVAITVPGDLWILGNHRLLCGDSRIITDVERLLGGKKANLVVTSPPYAAQREYDKSSGFERVPPDEYVEWYAELAANVRAVLAEDGSYFLNIKEHCDSGQRHLYVKDLTIAHVRKWGWMLVDEFCWRNTRNGVPGGWNNRFKNAWEPVFHFTKTDGIKFHAEAVSTESDDVFEYSALNPKSKSGSKLLGSGRRKNQGEGLARPSNVIEAAAESGQGSHAAPFPVALPEFFINAFTDSGDAVLDPFIGSGSTLIAADKTGRVGYGTEISPRYCDVIVRRWQEFTGKTAHLEDGRTPLKPKKVKAAA